MSKASERKAMTDALAGYCLMGIPQLAAFLSCTEPVVAEMLDQGVIPSVMVGKRQKVDPVDAIVHVLASREGLTAEAYWKRHGEATAEHARRYIARVRKVQAA